MAQDHHHFMSLALERAKQAGARGNRPIASLIVRDGQIIGQGENSMFSDFDPSAHAEIAALRHACASLKTLELPGTTLYTTIEPCPMCFWAMLESRIGTVVMGGRYATMGRTDVGRYSVESFLDFTGRSMQVVTGVLQRECEEVRTQWSEQQAKR